MDGKKRILFAKGAEKEKVATEALAVISETVMANLDQTMTFTMEREAIPEEPLPGEMGIRHRKGGLRIVIEIGDPFVRDGARRDAAMDGKWIADQIDAVGVLPPEADSLEDKATHLLSEHLNDNAPIGEEAYRPAARAVIALVMAAKGASR